MTEERFLKISWRNSSNKHAKWRKINIGKVGGNKKIRQMEEEEAQPILAYSINSISTKIFCLFDKKIWLARSNWLSTTMQLFRFIIILTCNKTKSNWPETIKKKKERNHRKPTAIIVQTNLLPSFAVVFPEHHSLTILCCSTQFLNVISIQNKFKHILNYGAKSKCLISPL